VTLAEAEEARAALRDQWHGDRTDASAREPSVEGLRGPDIRLVPTRMAPNLA